ncbi:hypothetical protein CMI44_01190 [Candidatus Pacearchaeota archaeon]|nr:hypothetical protein [Candidatus Pacearchaeota archaeon]
MSNVLLIIPRYDVTKSNKKDYSYQSPVGLGYICATLRKEEYKVDCLNLNHSDKGLAELIHGALKKRKYDFVCTGHLGVGYPVIEKIINAVKSYNPNQAVIVGGPIISSEPEFMAENLKFDFGVVGEGEVTIIELLDFIKKNKDVSKVKGIVYKGKSGKIIRTSPRERIEDLDTIPFPDYSDFGLNEKMDNMYSIDSLYGTMDHPRTYFMIGSRGCPFQCTFCYQSLGQKYKTRSVKNIIKELEFAIDKYRANSFHMYDDLFSVNKERLYDFCKEVKKLNKRRNVNLRWVCSLWVSTVDEELLKFLKDSGCTGICFGFESYSKKVLKSMKKSITPEQIDNAMKACMKVHMPIIANFIFGDVTETKETAKETLDYWKEHCNDQAKLFFIHAYPGSEIYNHCIRKGLIKDKLDFIRNKIPHTFFMNMTDKMTDKEFEDLKKEIYRLKVKHGNYVVPFKVKKTDKKDVYNLSVKCPFCKQTSTHKNNYFSNRFFYRFHVHCRNCGMRYHLVSKVYKFTMDHYVELDFFRRNYLEYRGMLLRKKI